MSKTPASSAAPRKVSDAAATNERIRALVDAADGTWPAEDYEILLQEWAAAVARASSAA